MGRILHLPDVPETAIPAGRWQPLNSRLGIRAFGVNAVVMDPGEALDIEHDEADCGHQEVYVVVSGRARAEFRLGDERVEAGPGDVVAVPDPGETRDYRALEPGTRIVCFGAAPVVEHPYGEWIAEDASA
jgi:mannose-6-phosphate isomerase-like protein (cupin superfamily)